MKGAKINDNKRRRKEHKEKEECRILYENDEQITLFPTKICMFDIFFVTLRAFCMCPLVLM